MLTTNFDFIVARFPTWESRDQTEISQADMVIFDSMVEGGIYHSHQLNWKGDLSFYQHPEQFIRSEKERKAIPESRTFFTDQGYTLETVEATPELSQEFMELYRHTTLNRNRAIDVEAELVIKKNMSVGIPVWLFGLFKDGKLESGLLASQHKDEMRVMFGAKKRFDQIRGGVGGVLEMELLTFCFERGYKKISHGLSTNPAGIVDTAGVFEFKARYGFSAFPVGEWRTTFIMSEKVAQTNLVFVTAKDSHLTQHIVLKNDEDEATPNLAKYQTNLVPFTEGETLKTHLERAQYLVTS